MAYDIYVYLCNIGTIVVFRRLFVLFLWISTQMKMLVRWGQLNEYRNKFVLYIVALRFKGTQGIRGLCANTSSCYPICALTKGAS